MTLRVSFAIVYYARHEFLDRCLNSLTESIVNASSENFEIIVVLGGSIEEGLRVIESYRQTVDIRYFVAEKMNKSEMRNVAAVNARSDIIYFLDDDIEVNREFAGKVIEKFDTFKEAAVIGGPNITPPDSSLFERLQGYVLSSLWGAASMSRRYKASSEDLWTDQDSLILCNMGFRKSMMARHDEIFDVRLNYNEENDMLVKLKNMNMKFVVSPNIAVFHYRRKRLYEYVRQVFSSGLGRASSIKINHENFRVVNIMPMLFLLYLVSLLFFRTAPVFVPLLVYILVNLVVSARILIVQGESVVSFFLLYMLFFLSHISYGIGIITGFILPLGRRYHN